MQSTRSRADFLSQHCILNSVPRLESFDEILQVSVVVIDRSTRGSSLVLIRHFILKYKILFAYRHSCRSHPVILRGWLFENRETTPFFGPPLNGLRVLGHKGLRAYVLRGGLQKKKRRYYNEVSSR